MFNILLKNGVRNLFSKGNPISFENNEIIFNIYSKNSDIEQNVNNNNLEQSAIYKESEDPLISLIYSPPNINKEELITFIFTNPSHTKVKISLDCYKTVDDLIKLYFDLIKKPYLFLNENITFFYNGSILYQGNGIPLTYYFAKDEINYILVMDEEGMI